MEVINKIRGFKPGIRAKDIHGKVCVDLHNTKSGFTERIETENMVTNAINNNYLATYIQASSDDTRNIFPIYKYFLGRVMLFDNILTENENNINFPSNSHLVAYAGQTVNTDDINKGSIDNSESIFITKGYKTVWNFTTNQANGIIRSLSRTGCGDYASNMLYNKRYQKDNTGSIINTNIFNNDPRRSRLAKYDYENKDIIIIGSVPNSGELEIYKYKFDFSTINVYEPFPTKSTNEYITLHKKISWYNNAYSHQKQVPMYEYNGYTYMPGTIDNLKATYDSGTNTTTMYFTKFKTSDLSYDTDSTFYVEINDKLNNNFYDNNDVIMAYTLASHYIYIPNNDRNKIYKIDMEGTHEVTTINLPSVYKSGISFVKTYNDVIIILSADNASSKDNTYILYPDDTLITINDKGGQYPNTRCVLPGEIMLYLSTTDMSPWFLHVNSYIPSLYLGTIANLSEPVTKTDTQTMKITYSLVSD